MPLPLRRLLFPPWRLPAAFTEFTATATRLTWLPRALISSTASPRSRSRFRFPPPWAKRLKVACSVFICQNIFAAPSPPAPGRHLFIINFSCKLQNVYSGATAAAAAIAVWHFFFAQR